MTNTSPTERRAKAEGAIEALRAAAEEMHVGIGVGAIPFEVRPAIKSWLRRLAEQRLDRSRRESAEPAAAPAVVEPPTTWPAEPVREQLLRAIDFNYVASLGYSGPEELLAAYDTSRTPTDQTAPVCRDAEGCHRVVPCDPGCGARDLLAEATRPQPEPGDQTALRDRIAEAVEECRTLTPAALADAVLAVLPEPTDRAASDLEIARTTNQRLNREKQRLESELAAYRRAVSQWEISERGTYIPHASLRAIGLASGKDILGSVRHLKHFERVEQAEAEVERLRADRAAALREAALHLYTALFPAVYDDMGQKAAEGVNRAVSELRRMADETATETPRPERDQPVYLSTPCAACAHPYNWHCGQPQCQASRNGDLCGCRSFTPGDEPAAGARQDGAQP